MLKKLYSTKQIYDIVTKAIDTREKSGVRHNDTLQTLLDGGEDRLVVVGVRETPFSRLNGKADNVLSLPLGQFIMGLLIAGARATGTTGDFSHINLSSF